MSVERPERLVERHPAPHEVMLLVLAPLDRFRDLGHVDGAFFGGRHHPIGIADHPAPGSIRTEATSTAR